MKKMAYLSITLILFSAVGCATQPQGEYFEYDSLEEEPEILEFDEINQVPEVKLFISAPYTEEKDELILDWAVETIPEEEVPEISVIQPDPPEKESLVDNDVAIVVAESIVKTAEAEAEKNIPAESAVLSNSIGAETSLQNAVEQESFERIEELSVEIGQNIPLLLDGEGWIYNGSENQFESVHLTRRMFEREGTVFYFTFDEPGSYELIFALQDPGSGNQRRAMVTVSVDDEQSDFHSPVVIDPPSELGGADVNMQIPGEVEKEISAALEESNIPELVSSFDKLISRDEPVGHEVLSDAFTLLEEQGGYNSYLISLAEKSYSFYPYDNRSAEMLYKAAIASEKPGPGQNVEKALELFKLVIEHFPISIYCDKSEERVRYLERHFMKIY